MARNSNRRFARVATLNLREKAASTRKVKREVYACPACAEKFTTDLDYKKHYKEKHMKIHTVVGIHGMKIKQRGEYG